MLVAVLAVQLEPDVLAAGQIQVDSLGRVARRRCAREGPVGVRTGRRTTAVWMWNLRSVDTEIADLFDAVLDPDVDGVAVDHIDHEALERPRHRCGAHQRRRGDKSEDGE